MCRHCVRNPQPGSSKTPKKGCFEKNEEGKAVQFNLGEQTKVRPRNARMTMGGSAKREKEGLWLSWKEAIQRTALEEDHLRDLMLSKYSYASIPYKKKRQVTSAGIEAGDGVNPQQEKRKATQVEESPSLQRDDPAKAILQVLEDQDEEDRQQKVNRTQTGKEEGVREASK